MPALEQQKQQMGAPEAQVPWAASWQLPRPLTHWPMCFDESVALRKREARLRKEENCSGATKKTYLQRTSDALGWQLSSPKLQSEASYQPLASVQARSQHHRSALGAPPCRHSSGLPCAVLCSPLRPLLRYSLIPAAAYQACPM
jgi:hypothetical protein